MNVMILGPAGCGKSTLTDHFGKYLLNRGYKVKFLNLDPGCLTLPYKCDFNIREKFTIEQIMLNENLGPSGATTRAMEKLSEINIPHYQSDFSLIDTPGQLEVFAFHKSGSKIIQQFSTLVGIFILDASLGTADLPASFLYSLAIGYRLGIDTINIINKVDLLEEEEIQEIKNYLRDPAILKERRKTQGVLSDIYIPVSEILQRVLPAQRNPCISAKNNKGFDELLDMLHEVKCACGDMT